MGKKAILGSIFAYSLSHALVDAACAATIFAIALRNHNAPQSLFELFVLYNLLAFATQPIWGLLLDRLDSPVQMAVLGNLLVASATLCLPLPFLAVALAGLGNAFFHVGGGAISLNLIPGKAALPGIYVAPGGVGLAIGMLIGKAGHFVAWPLIALLVACGVWISALPQPETGRHPRLPGDMRWFETVIVLLLMAVAMRSLIGLSLSLPWKSNSILLAALTGAAFLGKALGGFLGDRFGWSRTAMLGLALSAPLLSFFAEIPMLAILGIFCFNLTMPITLTCLAEMLPGKYGFAFGLTTLALILGAWPTFTAIRATMGHPAFIFVTILITIAVLSIGLGLYNAYFRMPKDERWLREAQPNSENRIVKGRWRKP